MKIPQSDIILAWKWQSASILDSIFWCCFCSKQFFEALTCLQISRYIFSSRCRILHQRHCGDDGPSWILSNLILLWMLLSVVLLSWFFCIFVDNAALSNACLRGWHQFMLRHSIGVHFEAARIEVPVSIWVWSFVYEIHSWIHIMQ